MQTIYDLITLDVLNEHDLEHVLEHDSLFSTPKIFDAKGDLSKRWYVYFSYRHPETGKLKRVKNIYGKANRFKTKEERYAVLNLYKKRLIKLLEEGFNPFKDNSELYKSRLSAKNESDLNTSNSDLKITKKKQQNNKKIIIVADTDNTEPLYSEAFGKALELKTNVVAEKTYGDYKNRLYHFEQWLKQNKSEITTINEITRKFVVEYLNEIQVKTSARNRNNTRAVLSSIFQTLKDNEIIPDNFVKSINTLKSKPTRNKSYTEKELDAIFKHLEKEDELLLLFIKFIGYNLLRPIEICRLQVKDINLEQKTLTVKAKNNTLKTKLIPEILVKELPDLSKLDKDALLFTPDKIGGYWDARLINRRDHFSKRYSKIVKEHFGFDNNYGLYSFRHTFITKLYRELVKEMTPEIAKSKLMLITGHATMDALKKYLRTVDAELPADYSDLFK